MKNQEDGEKGRGGDRASGRAGEEEPRSGGDLLSTSPPPLSPSPPLLVSSRSRSALEILGGLAIILVVMSWIQFGGPAILDNDGYYHIRWAVMLRESFPRLPEFKALPLTTLDQQNYVDHHYLFHVMLIPFTLGDLRLGAKAAAVVFSSLGIASLFGLLVAFQVQYRWLWLAPLVAGSEHFLYRMSMTRAPALSLVFLGLGTYFIFKRRHALLGVLSFIFVWSYSLFPLMLAFALAYSLAVYLSERRLDLWGAFAAGIGTAAGLVINPYFPRNLSLFRQHVLMKYTGTYAVDVGIEWYPYEAWAMLGISAVSFVVYFVALVAFEYRDRLRDVKPLFFLIVSFILLLMAFKSRRFIEYWPPFAALFAAFTISPKLERLKLAWLGRARDRVLAAIAAAVVTTAGFLWMGGCLYHAREDVRGETDPYAYRGASEWIAANTPPGTVIFNSDWDDFPMLFYYNPNHVYIVGLDPTYLHDRDPDLWKLYAGITLGNEYDPGPLIRGRFGAQYVFTDNEHPDLLRIAHDSGDFEKVYEDRYTTVLRVRESDEPAKEE